MLQKTSIGFAPIQGPSGSMKYLAEISTPISFSSWQVRGAETTSKNYEKPELIILIFAFLIQQHFHLLILGLF
jgi:hypothetical protein